ncbi:MAG: hypothetical protein HY598_03605 [Candidatus Omnitrophica bacterium]|nr:hypothetical protein [Candidatus Omnitrophota bacterium]
MAAAAVVLLLGAAAWWRLSVTSKDTAMLPRETWERVKEAYPIPSEAPQALTPESQAAAALIDANPFSPQRDRAVSAADPSGQGALRFAPAAAEPQFAYKGRLQLGARQRAVMEETTAGKTYFLEVGQAVAGFKVLDIDEKRVLLSDPQTHEEVAVPLTSARSP